MSKTRVIKKTAPVERFWETKTLAEMSRPEWESLCDGCAKCCLNKFIDDDTIDESSELKPTAHIEQGEQIHFSNIACFLLNEKSCQCTQYEDRTTLVPDCVRLTQDNLDSVFFMPPSCTYRRLQEGRNIPSWHPLLHKGKKSAMHNAGMSVRGKIVKDDDVSIDKFEDYIVSWPLNDVD